jgi:pimeloyl-ACP methyl ester carboxylesterase
MMLFLFMSLALAYALNPAYEILDPESGDTLWRGMTAQVNWQVSTNDTRLLRIELSGNASYTIAPICASFLFDANRPGAPGSFYWWVPENLPDGDYFVTLVDYASGDVLARSPIFSIGPLPPWRSADPEPIPLASNSRVTIDLPAVPKGQDITDYRKVFYYDKTPQGSNKSYAATISFSSLTLGANQSAFFQYGMMPDYKVDPSSMYNRVLANQITGATNFGRYYFVVLPDGPPSAVSIDSSVEIACNVSLPCPDCDLKGGFCSNGQCHCFSGYSGTLCDTKIPIWNGGVEPIPVLVIPGVGGTRLEVQRAQRKRGCMPGNAVWAGSIGDTTSLAWGLFRGAGYAEEYLSKTIFDFSSGQVTDDPNNPVQVPFWDDPNGLQQIEYLFSNGLCSSVGATQGVLDWVGVDKFKSAFPYWYLVNQLIGKNYTRGQTLRGFPYDWRQSNRNAGTLSRLRETIQQMAKASPCGQIDIIAHSMGNLLFRSYLATFPEDQNLIRRFVALAAPWNGATGKIFKAFTEGYNFDNCLVSTKTARSALVQTPSAYELLPNVSAFSGSPFKCVDQNGNSYSGEQVFEFLENHQRMNLDYSRPSNFSGMLQWAQGTWDLWKRANLSWHVKFYNFCSGSKQTQNSVKVGQYSSVSVLDSVPGDETVPLVSSSAPPFQPFLSLSDFDVDHMGMAREELPVQYAIASFGSGPFWEGQFSNTNNQLITITQNHSVGQISGPGIKYAVSFALFDALDPSLGLVAFLYPNGAAVSVMIGGNPVVFQRFSANQCIAGQSQICSNFPNGRFFRPCVYGQYTQECYLVSCFPGFCESVISGVNQCSKC